MNKKITYILSNNTLILGVAFIVYTIAAFNLIGYYHPDEHFQILEFANYKLGKLTSDQLSWEYSFKVSICQ